MRIEFQDRVTIENQESAGLEVGTISSWYALASFRPRYSLLMQTPNVDSSKTVNFTGRHAVAVANENSAPETTMTVPSGKRRTNNHPKTDGSSKLPVIPYTTYSRQSYKLRRPVELLKRSETCRSRLDSLGR